jgi:hypothetical protein
MVSLRRGRETDLIEIPASWYLDDLPPMLFIKKSPNSHAFRQSAGHRADVARPVRLGLPRIRLRRVPDHHPPGCVRTAHVLMMLGSCASTGPAAT